MRMSASALLRRVTSVVTAAASPVMGESTVTDSHTFLRRQRVSKCRVRPVRAVFSSRTGHCAPLQGKSSAGTHSGGGAASRAVIRSNAGLEYSSCAFEGHCIAPPAMR